jgi:hypothetical protein
MMTERQRSVGLLVTVTRRKRKKAKTQNAED